MPKRFHPPDFGVDNPVLAPAAKDQTEAATANDGVNSLVVWSDYRAGNYDIYAARVAADGWLLDPTGIPISTAVDDQLEPSVVFGGGEYWVVWADHRSGTGWDLYGARVTPAEVVLDTQALPVSIAAGAQRRPSVTFNGSQVLAVWQDGRGTDSDIYGARINSSGVVLDAAGFLISGATKDQTAPAAVFDGTHNLVVWQDRHGGTADIYGTLVAPTGTVTNPAGISISTATADQTRPSAVYGGPLGGFFTAWSDAR